MTGLCECGCGGTPTLHQGEYRKFIHGHNNSSRPRLELTVPNLLAKTKPTSTGCLEWIGARNRNGYGRVKVGHRMIGAHRVVWSLSTGKEIPDGMLVCHHCDNPPCINPDHLFLGDAFTNMRDAVDKGRFANRKCLGEAHHAATLTDAQIRDVRRRHASGQSMYSLGKEFGLTTWGISQIVQMKVRRAA